jgi:hypothetical protein
MRDPTTVNPYNPIQFAYTWASMSKVQSKKVQTRFSEFADTHDIKRNNTDLMLD